MNKIEKRTAWRAKAFVKVLIYYDQKEVESYSEDFGEGGIKIETFHKIPVEQKVIIQIPSISLDKVSGKVLSEELSSEANIYRIKFDDLNVTYKNKLLKFVFDKLKR